MNLKQTVEDVSNTKFNSCLLNLYHDGNEGIGWHSDDEKSIGDKQPHSFGKYWSGAKILV